MPDKSEPPHEAEQPTSDDPPDSLSKANRPAERDSPANASRIAEQKEWIKKLPNKLTLLRACSIPILLLLYPLNFLWLNVFCAVLFAAAAITDFLDGYLARRYNAVTPLGQLLDPIADKMLTTAALVLIAAAGHAPALLVGLLICRDIGVSGIRLIALEKSITIAVSEFGKWKTAAQSIAIFCLLIDRPLLDLPFHEVGMTSLWIALALSFYSAWKYATFFFAQSQISLEDL